MRFFDHQTKHIEVFHQKLKYYRFHSRPSSRASDTASRQRNDDDPDGATSESPTLTDIDLACADHDAPTASAALPRAATAAPQVEAIQNHLFSLTSIGCRSRWFTRRICAICAPEVSHVRAG